MTTRKSETERRSRDRALAAMKKDPCNSHHGTWYGYVCGCRCEICMMAYRERYARRQAKDAREIKDLLEKRKEKR